MKNLNDYKQLTTLACSALLCGTLNAATVTSTLSGDVLFGDFTGTMGAGSFSYDDQLINGVGQEILLTPDFSLTFTIFGQTFTETDDIDFPAFPELEFQDGTPVSINFLVVGSIDEPGVGDLGFFDITETSPGAYSTEVIVNAVSPVPVPASIWLFGSGLIGLASIARRKINA